MTTLYRCDVCGYVIDPSDGDEPWEMRVSISKVDEDYCADNESDVIHVCGSCRPQSAEAHMHWLVDNMEADR
jgi:hypothetical protein